MELKDFIKITLRELSEAIDESGVELKKRVIFSRLVAGDTYESNERRGKRAVENLQKYLNQTAELGN